MKIQLIAYGDMIGYKNKVYCELYKGSEDDDSEQNCHNCNYHGFKKENDPRDHQEIGSGVSLMESKTTEKDFPFKALPDTSHYEIEIRLCDRWKQEIAKEVFNNSGSGI
jgi:hypothetical protein